MEDNLLPGWTYILMHMFADTVKPVKGQEILPYLQTKWPAIGLWMPFYQTPGSEMKDSLFVPFLFRFHV